MGDNDEVESPSASSESSDRTQTSSSAATSAEKKRDQPQPPGFRDRLRSLFWGKDDPSQKSSADEKRSREGIKPKASTESSKSFGAKAKPGSRRGTFFLGGSAILAGLAAFVGFNTQPQIGTSTCETQGCVYLSTILSRQNSRLSICDDFFSTICVEQTKPASALRGWNRTDYYSRLDEILHNIFKEKLEQFALPSMRPKGLTGNILDSEMQLGKFYMSCVNRYKSTGDALRFFSFFVNDLGIPMEQETSRQTLSILSALTRLSLVWGIENPFLNVELVPVRGSQYYLTRIWTMEKYGDDESGRFRGMNLTESQQFIAAAVKNGQEQYGVGDKYQKSQRFLTSVFSGADALSETYIREMVISYEAVQDFIRKFQSLGTSEKSGYPLFPSNFGKIEDLTKFPWRRALTYGVRQELSLSKDAALIVDNIGSVEIFAHLFTDARFHRVFRHYLHMWLLKKFGFAMGGTAQHLYCAENECPNLSSSELDAAYCFRVVSKPCLY